jgi:hypothetical protein
LERDGFFLSPLLLPLFVRFGPPSPLLYESERLFLEPPELVFFGIAAAERLPSIGGGRLRASSGGAAAAPPNPAATTAL